MAAVLAVEGVNKTFGTGVAVDAASFDVQANEFVSIVGPSGCGKSTLLRLVAGLISPTSGRILVRGSEVNKPISDVGMVFQSPVLLPWRTALDNILFVAEIGGRDPSKHRARARELIELAGLAGFEGAYPHELSGGMQQRVAICRALLLNPTLILMDEPFGALDALTREQMNLEMLRIWRESGKTIIFVTHSIQEAVFLASHCAVLTAGPARMAEYFPIELPCPRGLPIKTTDEFGAYARRIYASLGLSAGA